MAPGDPAPWFYQRTQSSQRYYINVVAGRYLVLCFFGSAASPGGRAALGAVARQRDIFNGATFAFFGMTTDPEDEAEKRVADQLPGIHYFYDFDGKVSRLYGALPRDPGAVAELQGMWVVLDPALHVMANIPFRASGGETEELFAFLRSLPAPHLHAGIETPAPVIVVPRVFDEDLCRRLIALFEQHGGGDSGYMREADGKSVGTFDHRMKSRRDYRIQDSELIAETSRLCVRRVFPEIAKVCHFCPTRIERYIIARYAAEEGGHFVPHRDNDTPGTEHRRFAVSINLNGDFEGGEIHFPEYGARGLKAPAGAAVVFSGALLHAVSRVRRGWRYAFLPFVYDEAAQKLREANRKLIEQSRPK